MLLSMNWLREFVPYEGNAQDLGDRLTMLGLELEEIQYPFAGISDIIVGYVAECAKHPEADKLSVCRVDVGSEVLDIVCGAPNVAQGQKVPVAPVGATLPGGMTIKKAKLRGAPSNGMICSEAELALSDGHSGIMVLRDDAPVGAKLIDALALDTELLDIGITPNRGDCLSILGLAREVALAYGLPLTLPRLENLPVTGDTAQRMRISIADPELCPVYQGCLIDNVSNGPSPDWLRFRLLAMGQRSISTLVDITNYILLGMGQPLHAFDADLLQGGHITVRPAANGEQLTTLDGQLRTLTGSDLTIRDGRNGERAVALAGVMGGSQTEVSDRTQNIFLECAIFQPAAIRKTAKRLNLSSEASYRYERGVDQGLSEHAVRYAAQLVAVHGGGSLVGGLAKAEPKPWVSVPVRFRPGRCNDLLGHTLETEFCSTTLTRLGCELDAANPQDWAVTPPSYRLDIQREVDLIEEVARVYGIDRFEPVLPRVARCLDRAGAPESEFLFWQRVRQWGKGLGLNEVINYSFVGQKELDRLGLPTANRIPIQNPLNAEQDVLRTELAPGLLNALRNNLAQGNTGLRLFELAHVFHADSGSDTGAGEPGRLGILLHGDRYDSAWPHSPADASYADLRGILEHFFTFLHLPQAAFTRQQEAHSWLRPAVNIDIGDRLVGHLGRVQPDIADAYHAKKDVWVAELDMTLLARLHAGVRIRHSPLPVYPAVRRDITLAVPYTLSAETVIAAIRDLRLPLMESVQLLDVYTPENDPQRRLTYRMTFRHAQRTLEDAEVDKLRDTVAQKLPGILPVTL